MHKINAELAAIDEMPPRSLTRQDRDPDRQSRSYYQLSYTRDMKSRTEYLARDCLRDVRCQIGTYKHVEILSAEWMALSIQYSRLQDEAGAHTLIKQCYALPHGQERSDKQAPR